MPSASSTSSQQSSSTLPEHWPAWLLTGLPSLLCLMVCALLAYAVQQSHAQRDLTAQQDRVKQQLQVMRDRLVAQAQVAFSPTEGVSTLIQTDGHISQDRFTRLVERSLTLVPYIRSVVAAPGDVARHVFPLVGNERVLNMDYRTVPAQWAQVRRAMELGHPIIVGPVKMVQGGLGLIQRSPVFLRDGEQVHYWGQVSVALDLERFLVAGGISADEELDLALLNPAASEDQRIIWGNASAQQSDSVTEQIRFEGADWTL